MAGGGPHRAWTEARAGPVGGRGIQREPCHRDIDAGQIPRVFAPQETKGAGEGRLHLRSLQRSCGESTVIARGRAHLCLPVGRFLCIESTFNFRNRFDR